MLPLLPLLLLACAETAPTSPEDLYGMWSSSDGTDWRVLAFAEGDLYELYFYPVGDAPAVSQTGSYDVIEEHLVTYPSDGGEYSNRFLRFAEGDRFTIEVDKETGESREYDWTDALP